MIEKHDSEELYCRKLGHKVSFKYCRLEKGTLPCSKIMDCWFEKMDINLFISNNYTESEIESVLKPVNTRIYSIVELIEKARNA